MPYFVASSTMADEPRIQSLEVSDGFMVYLVFGDGVNIHFPGHNRESLDAMRSLVRLVTEEANALEKKLGVKESAGPDNSGGGQGNGDVPSSSGEEDGDNLAGRDVASSHVDL